MFSNYFILEIINKRKKGLICAVEALKEIGKKFRKTDWNFSVVVDPCSGQKGGGLDHQRSSVEWRINGLVQEFIHYIWFFKLKLANTIKYRFKWGRNLYPLRSKSTLVKFQIMWKIVV